MLGTRSAATALALLVGVSSLASAQETKPFVSVRIAKTERFVSPFGTSSEREGKVIVRLFRHRNGREVLVDAKRVDVQRDGSFKARFDRPSGGECRATVRIAGAKTRDAETFPCGIPDFPSGRATLSDVTSQVTIDVLIAETFDQKLYGLMYRPKMRSDLGMAFPYSSDQNGGFWMKNTLIPLSIAFVDSNDVIVRILDMEPCVDDGDDCPSYSPDASYRMALEVNQGMFAEWGIDEGDRIEIER